MAATSEEQSLETNRSQNAAGKRGGLARLVSFLRPSKWLVSWEALVAASILPSVAAVMFQAAFDAGTVWLWIVIYILDLLYFASMVVRFVTGYKKRGVLVTERRKVVRNYLKRSFIPDLLSVLPLEVLAFAADSGGVALAACLRLNRCIRCYRVWTFISE